MMDKVVDYPFDGKEFPEGAIVGRYGKEGMTYFTGEFTKQGAGIFHPYPRTEPNLSMSCYEQEALFNTQIIGNQR